MTQIIEVPLFVNKSSTQEPNQYERTKHVMREMVKNGFIRGYLTRQDVLKVAQGIPTQPDFDVINIDWRNENATIKVYNPDVLVYANAVSVLDTCFKIERVPLVKFQIKGVYGMYFVLENETI